MKEIVRPDGNTEIIKYDEGKFRSCIIDTISAPQNHLFKSINEDKSLTHDDWRDFGWEVYKLYDSIKKLPDTLLIQVLGLEGKKIKLC